MSERIKIHFLVRMKPKNVADFQIHIFSVYVSLWHDTSQIIDNVQCILEKSHAENSESEIKSVFINIIHVVNTQYYI